MFAAPPKCTPSVTKTSLLIHFLASLWYTFIIHDDLNHRNLPLFDSYGGRSKYLTMWTLYLTFAANWFSFLVDFVQLTTNMFDAAVVSSSEGGYARSPSWVISIRDNLMSTLVCTLCTFVPILYWSIAAVDLEGIHTEEFEKISPLFGWFNHAVHTMPVIYVLVLTTCVNYEYAGIPFASFQLTGVIVGYVGWMGHCSKHNEGEWAYAFMMKQTDVEFVIFIASCSLIMVGIYLVTRMVASAAWNRRYYKLKEN